MNPEVGGSQQLPEQPSAQSSSPLQADTESVAQVQSAGDLKAVMGDRPFSITLDTFECPNDPQSFITDAVSTGEGEGPATGLSFPFSDELFHLLPDDAGLVDARFDPETSHWTASLISPNRWNSVAAERRAILGMYYAYVQLSFISNSGNVLGLHQSLPERWRDGFLVRTYESYAACKSAKAGNPDVLIVDALHPEWDRIERRALRHARTQLLVHGEQTAEQLRSLRAASQAVDECIYEFDPRTVLECQSRCLNLAGRLRVLSELLLGNAKPAPELTRWVMLKMDHQVVPHLASAGLDIASTFPSADELMVLPLMFFHRDETVLLRHTQGLAISPKAALLYLGADALHLRFFSSYTQDSADVLKCEDLLKIVLPYLRRKLDQANLDQPSRAEQESRNASDVQEIRSYVRGILGSLVLLADFGAFDGIFFGNQEPQWKYHNPRPFSAFEKGFAESSLLSLSRLQESFRRHAAEMVVLMRKAAEILPDEFNDTIPSWSEYFYGYYGIDEVEALNRFNSQRSSAGAVSFFDLVTGNEREEVEQYRKLHRARRPEGREERNRTQFFKRARDHTLHSREVWRRFQSAVRGDEPDLDDLIALRAPKALADFAVDCAKAAQSFPYQSPEHLLLSFLTEYITRFPPPLRPAEGLRRYLDEGIELQRKLFELLNAEESRGRLSRDRLRGLESGMQQFSRYLLRVNALGMRAE